MGELDGKTVVLTGANAGIGKETALELARRGARILMLCRNQSKGEQALADVKKVGDASLILCDLSSLKSVDAAADEVLAQADQIDVLVNNAGLILPTRKESVDGFELTFATNHLGPFHLTRRLLDRIRATKGARIVNVSSDAHRAARPRLNDLDANGGYSSMVVYGNTKLFNIWMTNALARRLDDVDVTVNALHPGVVRSSFGDESKLMSAFYKAAAPFIKDSKQGAATSIFLAASPRVAGVTGKYFANEKERRPRKLAHDVAKEETLWEKSDAMVQSVLAGAASA